jgi:DNA topoisomerase-1
MNSLDRLRKTGIRRVGSKESGFRYVRPDGEASTDEERVRIHGLRVPPAWSDVAMSTSETAQLQAVGRDAAGRWQYRYHASRVRAGERRKFDRLLAFGEALPRLRAALARDIALPGLPRERVLAAMLRIVAARFLRPGSRAYAERNGSYGVTTLERRHVAVRGATIWFDFVGKSGKRQHVELEDPAVATVVRQVRRMPGKRLFQYRDRDGRLIPVRRTHLNAYIREVLGGRFSVKDFRTWAGTLVCARALHRAGTQPRESRRTRRRKIAEAVAEAAARLRNTPAVCRASYISPRLIQAFEAGRAPPTEIPAVERLARRRSLHPAERALVRFLASPGAAAGRRGRAAEARSSSWASSPSRRAS